MQTKQNRGLARIEICLVDLFRGSNLREDQSWPACSFAAMVLTKAISLSLAVGLFCLLVTVDAKKGTLWLLQVGENSLGLFVSLILSAVILLSFSGKCSEWQKSPCQPKRGNCGSGFQQGTRTGDCKGTKERRLAVNFIIILIPLHCHCSCENSEWRFLRFRFKCSVPCAGSDANLQQREAAPSLEALEHEVVAESKHPPIRPGRDKAKGGKNKGRKKDRRSKGGNKQKKNNRNRKFARARFRKTGKTFVSFSTRVRVSMHEWCEKKFCCVEAFICLVRKHVFVLSRWMNGFLSCSLQIWQRNSVSMRSDTQADHPGVDSEERRPSQLRSQQDNHTSVRRYAAGKKNNKFCSLNQNVGHEKDNFWRVISCHCRVFLREKQADGSRRM